MASIRVGKTIGTCVTREPPAIGLILSRSAHRPVTNSAPRLVKVAATKGFGSPKQGFGPPKPEREWVPPPPPCNCSSGKAYKVTMHALNCCPYG